MNLDFRRLATLLYPAVFIACVLAYVCACAPAHGANNAKATAKAYSPFDEPKPRTPKEFATDVRLDQRVKVFCKSRNLKDLFADLSAKTGVRITIAKEVSSQRPIIYFHDRPLRDVLTEISAIYGFHWLVSGKSGAYEYELFEDAIREKRRAQAPMESKAAQDELLLDFADVLLGDDGDKALEKLAAANPQAHRAMTSASQKALANVFDQLGTDFLSGVLADGASTLKCGELPPAMQQAVCDYYNQQQTSVPPAVFENLRAQGLESHSPTPTAPATRADLADALIQVDSVESGGLPRFGLQVTRTNGRNALGLKMDWPSRYITADDMRAVADAPAPERITNRADLPDETKVTISSLRWLPYRRKALLLGDVLQGIALQSGKDIIADHYLLDKSISAMTEQPLKQAVETVCKQFDYTCQVDGATIRLRHNKWFSQNMHSDPPAKVVEDLWAKIIANGALTVRELVSVASLSADQRQWPGWKFIPGADSACRKPCAVALLASLSEAQQESARNGGLSVSELTADEQRKVREFIAESGMSDLATPEAVNAATIALSTAKPQVVTGDGGTKMISFSGSSMRPEGGLTSGQVPMPKDLGGNAGGGRRIVTTIGAPGSAITLDSMNGDVVAAFAALENSTNESITLVMADPRNIVPASVSIPIPLSEADRKEAAAQRKADAEAEKVEVLG